LSLEDVDLLDDSIHKGGDAGDIGVGFDPAGGLEQERSGVRDWGRGGRSGFATGGSPERDDGGDLDALGREETAAEEEPEDREKCDEEADGEQGCRHATLAAAA
jgi:hypothetical protein